jgi:hypothetical protein
MLESMQVVSMRRSKRMKRVLQEQWSVFLASTLKRGR